MQDSKDSPRQALLTDLYELTMLQCYYEHRMNREAVFELTFRNLPSRWNVLIACGLDEALDYLENLAFSPSDLEYLAHLKLFSSSFLDYLANLRFTGKVYALPEGTPFFPDEPLVQIVAPLPEAQLVESYLLNLLAYQTKVASKALRMVLAAQGRPVVDFSLRRSSGSDAALKVARALFIVSGHPTSNVLAGKTYGIPVTGTMAHSFIQAHDSELSAFRSFLDTYPEATLLVDTYDTLEGVHHVITLARERGPEFRVKAIRLDSGNLLELSKGSRALLDDAGLHHVKIFASGGLDEHSMSRLLESGAPIDGFGVGAQLADSADGTMLDSAYKMVAYDGRGRIKLSTGKLIWPMAKQVFRREEHEYAAQDTIGLSSERLPGRPLLELVMDQGRRIGPGMERSLDALRRRFDDQIARVPNRFLSIENADPPYPVQFTESLHQAKERTIENVRAHS